MNIKMIIKIISSTRGIILLILTWRQSAYLDLWLLHPAKFLLVNPMVAGLDIWPKILNKKSKFI